MAIFLNEGKSALGCPMVPGLGLVVFNIISELKLGVSSKVTKVANYLGCCVH